VPSFIQDYRIRTKLSVVITLACLLVLLLVCLTFGGLRFFELRRETSRHLQSLFFVLNDRLAESLLHSDRNSSRRLLKSLRRESAIGAAYLFDRNHEPFAESFDVTKLSLVESKIRRDFPAGIPVEWRALPEAVLQYDLTSLRLFAPVYYQQKYLGGLYLLADLKQQNRELAEIVLLVLSVGGLAVAFAWGISARLQRPISEPILQLARLTETILHTNNYSLRGKKQANDEIGLLVDGFNNMLGQIEQRQKALTRHRALLEQKVAERTDDLTQTVRALQEARQLAESANQAKSAFLANVTHELRTPMIGVLGMNELLQGTTLDKNQQHFVAAVQHSGYELLDHIDEILEFSRIESGHLSLQTHEVDLSQLVEEVILLLAERVYHKGLDFIWRIEPQAMCVVAGDGQRLKQILVNLLGNALKFTAQGQVALTLQGEGDFFVFRVTDSGVGIAPTQQARIFEAFRQADESIARVYGGTGLGLAIVKELTLLMGGELGLESLPGKGSCFEVRLPLPWLKAAYAGLPENFKGAPLALLEPAETVRQGLTQLLEDLGFEVQVFSCAAALLASANAGQQSAARVILSSCLDDETVRMLSKKMGLRCAKILRLQKSLPSSVQKIAGVDEIYTPCLRQILMQGFEKSVPLNSLPTLPCGAPGGSA